jgi:hypothetical protein
MAGSADSKAWVLREFPQYEGDQNAASPKRSSPTRLHKGRAVLDVYEIGVHRTRTLGAWGSPEAEAEYKRFLTEFATGVTERPTGPDVTVNEVLLAFLKHAEQHYRHLLWIAVVISEIQHLCCSPLR